MTKQTCEVFALSRHLKFLIIILTVSSIINHSRYKFAQTNKLSKPKLNQQLNSTEFEVGLHSYPEVQHHQPHKLSVLLLLTSQLAGRDLCVQLYSHRQK